MCKFKKNKHNKKQTLKMENKENPLELLINNLKKQVNFCDNEIEKFNLLKDSRKRLLEVYQNRQKEGIYQNYLNYYQYIV